MREHHQRAVLETCNISDDTFDYGNGLDQWSMTTEIWRQFVHRINMFFVPKVRNRWCEKKTVWKCGVKNMFETVWCALPAVVWLEIVLQLLPALLCLQTYPFKIASPFPHKKIVVKWKFLSWAPDISLLGSWFLSAMYVGIWYLSAGHLSFHSYVGIWYFSARHLIFLS